jgi:hypothetical protein
MSRQASDIVPSPKISKGRSQGPLARKVHLRMQLVDRVVAGPQGYEEAKSVAAMRRTSY